MEKPISLERLFKEKIFRIPDYQRGYAWQKEQLKAFWEDLVNLQPERSHYTGVLTLTEVRSERIAQDSREFWLVEDHSYRLYNVVDGQQRLTTFVVFVQAFADFFQKLPENVGRPVDKIYITDSLSLADLQDRYLFKTNPLGGFRTYKFGYTDDNPSQKFLQHQILGERGGGGIEETFYTLNLGNAQTYFWGQIEEFYRQRKTVGLTELFKKLTKRLLFNEYAIEDEFDVFVAFETMNNRGKKLSDLELLKNRLIYLTTLYSDEQLDVGGRRALRDKINDAWKEVYHQLGRNKSKPLNDDDFLRAHWITYFKYSRNTGRDYALFLLDSYFTSKNVHELIEKDVELDGIEEQSSDIEPEEQDELLVALTEDGSFKATSKVTPDAIREYIFSLGESAVHWFDSFYPNLVSGRSAAEKQALDRLNRVGIGYFRPLVMVILKREPSVDERVAMFNLIERFLFLVFRLGTARANYGSSEFYNAARALDRGDFTLKDIKLKLEQRLAYTFHKDGALRIDEFYNVLFKKFASGSGYYGWSGLRYVLFEYEEELYSKARQRKVEWADFLKSERDRVSIEHIYPQTAEDVWEAPFSEISAVGRKRYVGSLGNLLLLSMSINSSLQNDAFVDKKSPKIDGNGKKTRNGYADGSHSEIEVAQNAVWGPEEIRQRGLRLLNFMEKRWNFRLIDEDREKLLFLYAEADPKKTA
jgi:uncharacterized protein with ParB-like and HNH nuclease domain